MFGLRKKNNLKIEYDPAKQKPVIRCSVCTGERTAFLKNLQNGKLTEIMAINSSTDLDSFKTACGVNEIEQVY